MLLLKLLLYISFMFDALYACMSIWLFWKLLLFIVPNVVPVFVYIPLVANAMFASCKR